jgi:hypothetical protein
VWITPLVAGGSRQHVQPTWRDHSHAKRHVTRVDEMYSWRHSDLARAQGPFEGTMLQMEMRRRTDALVRARPQPKSSEKRNEQLYLSAGIYEDGLAVRARR